MSAADLRYPHAKGEDDLAELASDGALSIEDAAAFVGCKRSYLYGLLQSGAVKSAKLGRHRVVLKRSLVQYLAERAKEDREEAAT